MKTALVAGASGLVGSSLVKMLLQMPEYETVHILVRKEIDLAHPNLFQHVADFDRLETLNLEFKVDDAFVTLGTTIAKAGSKSAFYKVDHDYVLSFARKALSLGATGIFVVSSMGASPSSSIFYNKVKGEIENDLKAIGFPRLGIFRPSLLLGPRTEKRIGEKLASWMMQSLDFMIPAKYKAIHVDKVAKKMVEMALKDEYGFFIFESDKLQ
ncbi:MAG: NAD-dependent epimerase/dehydratase family protein [Prolixibacteraceae bacterium]|nr:NAD-dependent epimerase/dehydratase family protein [Prolixibacteraceae bacterium]